MIKALIQKGVLVSYRIAAFVSASTNTVDQALPTVMRLARGDSLAVGRSAEAELVVLGGLNKLHSRSDLFLALFCLKHACLGEVRAVHCRQSNANISRSN